MTAIWFEQQKMIENNELQRETFLKEVTKEIIVEIGRINNNEEFKILRGNKEQIKCLQCNQGFLKRLKSKNGKSWWWDCSKFNKGCKAMFYDKNGKPDLKI